MLAQTLALQRAAPALRIASFPLPMQGRDPGMQAAVSHGLNELCRWYSSFGRQLKKLNPASRLERQNLDLETLLPIDKDEMTNRRVWAFGSVSLRRARACMHGLRMAAWAPSYREQPLDCRCSRVDLLLLTLCPRPQLKISNFRVNPLADGSASWPPSGPS